jgi:hypothetical protein
MNQMQLERLRRTQVRHFLLTNEKLRGEFAKFQGGESIVEWLSILKRYVEILVQSGDAIIATARSIPNCANRSATVIELAPELACFNYTDSMMQLKLKILQQRKNWFSAYVALLRQVAKGKVEDTEEPIPEYYWLTKSFDEQVNALEDKAISINALYEAQLRLLKVRIWMGQMGNQQVFRYEGDEIPLEQSLPSKPR